MIGEVDGQGATPAASSEYLLTPGLVYLNTGSAGPASRAVLDRMLQAWHEVESNPVVMIYQNAAIHAAPESVQERLAHFLGCSADELLITRSATEAMNSVAQGIRLSRGDRVLTTDQEHAGGSICWRYLARRQGVELDAVRIAPMEHDERALVQRFADAITPRTRVISVSHILTSTGLRMPIPKIAALARNRGILCVVDGAQCPGAIQLDLRSLGCHAYAACGHKWLLGPKGTGFLYISRDAAGQIDVVQREGGHRFVADSSGIGSLPLLAGLGAAVEAMQARGMATVERRILALRDHLYAGLLRIPNLRVMSAPPGAMASALVAVELPADIDGARLRITMLEKHKTVIKTVEKRWFNGIRISPHIFNTEEQIDAMLRVLRDAVS